jgi:hypothetical protein
VTASVNGAPVTPAAAQRMACDRDLLAVVVGGEHQPLDVYRLQRLATDAQRAALAAIYPTCPCCDTAFWRCEIHHLDYWEHGGPTNIANLVPVCTKLHHLVHDQHWQLTIDPDRTLHLHTPEGKHHTTIPPPAWSSIAGPERPVERGTGQSLPGDSARRRVPHAPTQG